MSTLSDPRVVSARIYTRTLLILFVGMPLLLMWILGAAQVEGEYAMKALYFPPYAWWLFGRWVLFGGGVDGFEGAL